MSDQVLLLFLTLSLISLPALSKGIWQSDNFGFAKWNTGNSLYPSEHNSNLHLWKNGVSMNSRPNEAYGSPVSQNSDVRQMDQWNSNRFSTNYGMSDQNYVSETGKQTNANPQTQKDDGRLPGNWPPTGKIPKTNKNIDKVNSWDIYYESNGISDEYDSSMEDSTWQENKNSGNLKPDNSWNSAKFPGKGLNKKTYSSNGLWNEKRKDYNKKTNKEKKTQQNDFKAVAAIDKFLTSTTPSYDGFVDEKPLRNPYTPATGDGKTGSFGTKDTSILDKLDKNDWYFGKDSNFPEIDVNSNLNIDLGELWDFEKRRGIKLDRKIQRRQTYSYREPFKCKCVDVTLCNEEDIVMSVEEEIIEMDDWRAITRCTTLTEVCCTKPKLRDVTAPSNDPEASAGPLSCGQRRFRTGYESQNLNGAAKGGEFPWLLKLETIQEDLGCGASLVHPQLVLTAAHCISSIQPKDLYVRAGMFNSNEESFQIRKVTKIIPHVDYNSDNPRNDIAMLVVAYPFKLTDNVNTICMPVTNDKWDEEKCVVAGWHSSPLNDEIKGILNKGLVSFLPQRECQNVMTTTDLWRRYVLHDSFVCAVEKNRRNACLGDEGSPLMCPSKKSPDTFLQIGLVSKSIYCDDFGRPGIFTNLLKFIDWVNEKAFELNLFDDFDVRNA
ncbi:hypothetical protein RUM43_014634 [Polyplax serrata]|uniref:Peptidase S1 domain-containing protein n=1 Tax=Polyplax serrata TaxID=468196 RepID=A0AAN8NWT2_POLSC